MVLLSGLTVFAQPESASPNLATAIDELLQPYNRTDHPGLAVAIVHHGDIVFSKGYGMANLENGLAFYPETVSDIGSVAKQFTDYAVVLLAQRGLINLDANIREYLPEVPDFGQPITVRHLIHHTSGLREIYSMLELAGWRDGDGIRQEYALDLVKNLRELNFPPGDQYLYCNTAYMLLADIISRVSEQPFEQWMHEHIFAPLGMEHTFIMDIQGELFPRCADSYAPKDKGWVKVFDNSTGYGQGGIYSTIPDLVKWMNNYRNPVIGGPEAVAQMQQRGILNNGDTLNYAFGLDIGSYRGLRTVSHTGSSAGYRAAVTWLPEEDWAVIVKSNFANFNSSRISHQLIDLLPFSKPEPVSVRPPTPKQEAAVFPVPSLTELAGFAGRYYSAEAETTYTLKVIDGKLQASHRKHGDFTLEATGPDTFSGPSFFAEVRFERDKKNKVTGLRVSNGRVMNLLLVRTQ